MGKSLDLCSAFPLKKKKKKCLHQERLADDRLSSLSDDVLLCILSFLACKEVVSTSVLSCRWRSLWMYTTTLHFNAPVPKATVVPEDPVVKHMARRHYVKGVNHVLWRHKGHYLKEFKIVYELNKGNQKGIDNWLVFAFAKKVQHLDLNLLRSGTDPGNLKDNYVFPGRILDFCRAKADSYGGKNECVQFDHFKCLKSLSLKSVDVTSEAINFFLVNCPFLERLEVVGNLKLEEFVISDPTLVLKYLVIKHCYNLKGLSISDFNLVSLAISAKEDLTLTNLPMLVELLVEGTRSKLTHSISQASSCFSQLEALILRGLTLEDATQLSNYGQLTKLERLVIRVEVRVDESLLTFISIINSCPRLEEFVLKLAWFGRPKRDERNMCAVETAAKNKSLKVFEFVGYYGRVSDDELIMHVMANTVCLEKIIIDPRNACLIDRLTYVTESEKEARVNALQQYEAFREYIPPHVDLLIR